MTYGPRYLKTHPDLVPVVDYIRENPGCTFGDIRRALGGDVNPGAMVKLHRRGYIRKVGRKDSVGRWEV